MNLSIIHHFMFKLNSYLNSKNSYRKKKQIQELKIMLDEVLDKTTVKSTYFTREIIVVHAMWG